MQKISLYIDTRDRRYAVRLAEYFSKYFASSMDVFLTDPEHDPAAISFRHTGPMVLLSDDPESYQGPKMDQVLLLSEQDGIDPYQSARDIAEKILTACHSRREEESRVMRAGNVQLEKQLSLLPRQVVHCSVCAIIELRQEQNSFRLRFWGINNRRF